jgi:hypothetical protein
MIFPLILEFIHTYKWLSTNYRDGHRRTSYDHLIPVVSWGRKRCSYSHVLLCIACIGLIFARSIFIGMSVVPEERKVSWCLNWLLWNRVISSVRVNPWQDIGWPADSQTGAVQNHESCLRDLSLRLPPLLFLLLRFVSRWKATFPGSSASCGYRRMLWMSTPS